MSELKASRGNKVQRNTLLLNGLGFLFLGSTIAFILWLQYKGKQDVRAQVEREQKKREYILSKLQMYQRMKAKEYTNIPI